MKRGKKSEMKRAMQAKRVVLWKGSDDHFAIVLHEEGVGAEIHSASKTKHRNTHGHEQITSEARAIL